MVVKLYNRIIFVLLYNKMHKHVVHVVSGMSGSFQFLAYNIINTIMRTHPGLQVTTQY